jgi:hypothetical protein
MYRLRIRRASQVVRVAVNGELCKVGTTAMNELALYDL